MRARVGLHSLGKLRKAHSFVLTPLVLRQGSHLNGFNKTNFDLWVRSKRVEYLPEGVPYKVVGGDYLVLRGGGTFVVHVNKPLILVSSFFSMVERQDVARHEFIEWQRLEAGALREERDARRAMKNPFPDQSAHDAAVRTENPSIRRGLLAKLETQKRKIVEKRLKRLGMSL